MQLPKARNEAKRPVGFFKCVLISGNLSRRASRQRRNAGRSAVARSAAAR